MSLADKYFIENCRDIIEHGSWDTNSEVRPRWEDGTPAHTVKKFCVVNRYNLQEEFPVMTLRRIYYRSAISNTHPLFITRNLFCKISYKQH